MTLEAILFDVDGTLADTEGLGHHPAYNQAFDSLGVPFRWDRDLYRTLLKQPGGRERIRHYLDAYAPELGPESAAVARDPDQWIAKVHQLKSDFFRDRVAAAVMARLEAVDDPELVRRGMTLFALPHHAAEGAALIWGTADRVTRRGRAADLRGAGCGHSPGHRLQRVAAHAGPGAGI